MNRDQIRVALALSRRLLTVSLALIVMLGVAAALRSETLTLSAIYPSPSGLYKKLLVTADAVLSRDGGGLAVGSAVPPTGSTKMTVMGGNVGIGTETPASKLSVAGGIQVGDDAVCAPGKAGTQRWNTAKLQVCDGSAWLTLKTVAPAAGGCSIVFSGSSGPTGFGVTYTPIAPVTGCSTVSKTYSYYDAACVSPGAGYDWKVKVTVTCGSGYISSNEASCTNGIVICYNANPYANYVVGSVTDCCVKS